MSLPAEPLGVYVHVPFCRVRCSYCAFAVTTSLRYHDEYFEALGAELRRRVPQGAAVDTVYLGGGTPSRASAEAVTALLASLAAHASFLPDPEVTLEANPEDVSSESLDAWAAAGVTRVSIGVQSLNDAELRGTGRLHDGAGAVAALERAVAAGFRVNADLMIGLPSQELPGFRHSLQRILEAGAGHLSCYLLDLEPGTALESRVERGVVRLPDEELFESAYIEMIAAAERAGLHQYEISNFARSGEESRHNLRYWEGRPYIGLGASAHSFDRRFRRGNIRDTEQYLERVRRGESAVEFEEEIDEAKARRERLFLSLRRPEGLCIEEFESLAGSDGTGWRTRGIEQGWLLNEPRVAFTTRGFLLSNELIAELF